MMGIVAIMTAPDVRILETASQVDVLEADIAALLADRWQIVGVLPADATISVSRIIFSRADRPDFAPA